MKKTQKIDPNLTISSQNCPELNFENFNFGPARAIRRNNSWC